MMNPRPMKKILQSILTAFDMTISIDMMDDRANCKNYAEPDFSLKATFIPASRLLAIP
jgi:hypothetical protein